MIILACVSKSKAQFPEFELVSHREYPPAYFMFDASPYLGIIDIYAKPVFYIDVPGGVRNFSPQPGGKYSFYGNKGRKFYVMDSEYSLVDSFETVNDVACDFHEFVLTHDGTAIMMGSGLVTMDMSELVEGGKENATVLELVIQEFSVNKELVFEWRSLDHIAVTDCDTELVDLRLSTIDYIHGNSIFVDTDENLIVSCRNTSGIIKINRTTGDIIWQLGGKNNEFSFLTSGSQFSGQHSVFRKTNGNLCIFDNGLHNESGYSRGLEYEFHEYSRELELLKEYKTGTGTYAPVMGSFSEAGDTAMLIGWGKNQTNDLLTLFDSSAGIILSVSYKPETPGWSYGLSYLDSVGDIFVTDRDTLFFDSTEAGDSLVMEIELSNNSDCSSVLYDYESGDEVFRLNTKLPLDIPPGGSENISVLFSPRAEASFLAPLHLYLRKDSLPGRDHMLGLSFIASGTSVSPAVIATDPGCKIKLFPNPFNERISIRTEGRIIDELQLWRYDGMLMLRKNISGEFVEIDSRCFDPGLYILSLKMKDGNYYYRKLLKN